MIEDIERIEVLRGPGGGVWGANAYTGVINIITKKPEDTDGGLISSTLTEYGDSYTHLRYGEGEGSISWRASAGYEDIKDSGQAGAGRIATAFRALNPFIGFRTFEPRDFARVWRFDSEIAYQRNEDTRYSFGAGHTNSERGDRELAGRYPRKDDLTSTTRLFSRVDHNFDPNTTGYLQWFGNYSVAHPPETIRRYGVSENDLEGQLQFPTSERHRLTIGGNLRWTHISSDMDKSGFGVFYQDGGYDEYWAGIYIVDRYQLSDRLELESQGRLDRYCRSDTDWSMRISALYGLDKQKDHVLRTSVARSFRAPGVMLRELRMVALGGLFNIIPNPIDLHNETTYSLEAGYIGKLSERVRIQVDSYYQRMEHLLGSINRMVGPVSNTFFANLDGANSYGGEAEISYRGDRNIFSLWYAYNELVTDKSNMPVRAFFPARHKAGVRYSYRIADNWRFQANYIYNDAIHINSSMSPSDDAPVFHKLDLTINKTFSDGNTDIMFGVADVLNETNGPVYDVSYFTSYETPGRTFFARARKRF